MVVGYREYYPDNLDHPPILISDNEQFSDITQLLHNEEDNYSHSNRNNSYKVNLCQREVRNIK